MGAAFKLDFTYRYSHPSEFTTQGLRLATFGGTSAEATEHPFFFDGQMRQPHVVANMLLSLAKVVSTRFWMPLNPALLDPVATSSEEMLRFEGFSSCCGVYARADVDASTFDADIVGRGTTNVDFNSAMRGALSRIRPSDSVRLAVGSDAIQLTSGDQAVVEKKVKLPIRWIKGFTEVQAYLPGLQQRFTVLAPEAVRFVRSLPRGGSPKQASWVTALGRGLRLSQRETKDAVRVTGTDRIRILEPMLLHAKEMTVWANNAADVSAWEVVFPMGRFTILISPEVSRGFSGEGQMLERLASGTRENSLPQVKAALRWQARIDAQDVCARFGLERTEVESALAVLGSRGLVGYDLARRAYFHRELPFDMGKVESLHPRLLDARKLVEEKLVRLVTQTGAGEKVQAEAYVQGSDVEHRVRLRPEGDICTCPWYGKHQGDRGPCKHVLAVRLLVQGDQDDAENTD